MGADHNGVSGDLVALVHAVRLSLERQLLFQEPKCIGV
jgi:hypothetical protein